MTAVAQHAAPHPFEDPHAVQMLLRTAEFSADPWVLDALARTEIPGEVLRKIAHNSATSEDTLEHLIDPTRGGSPSPSRAAATSPPSSSTGSPAG